MFKNIFNTPIVANRFCHYNTENAYARGLTVGAFASALQAEIVETTFSFPKFQTVL